MKKLVFGILAWLLFLSPMFAQRSEVGGLVGGSFYLGDINPSKLFSQTQLAFGAVYRYNLTTRWAVRGNALWGTVTASDAKFKNPRNLSFRSRISEFSVQAEINFLPYFTGSRRDYKFSPYLFGGVALFSFNPQARYIDPAKDLNFWVDLAPLRTEGQGLSSYPDKKTYSTTQFAIPFGLGFKYSLNATFSIGVEWGLRKTFTNYLDDIGGTYADPAVLFAHEGYYSAYFADRSDPRNSVGSDRSIRQGKTDWYSFAALAITAKIGKGRKEPCASYKTSAMELIRRSQK